MVELHFVKFPIGQRFFEEFGVGARVGDFALGHDDDEVRGEDGGEAMGNGDDGFASGEFFQGGLDHAFAFRVEGGGGFVQEENGGVFQEGAGDG